MKKVLTLFVLIVLALSSISIAQTSLEDYKKMDYIKVKEGQMETFLKLSQSELKSKFQAMSESGLIKTWSLYKAQYPGGEKSGYNFISIIRTTDIDKLIEQFNPIASPEYVPHAGPAINTNALSKITSLMKSEVWRVENFIQGDDSPPSKYMTMDYMEVAPGKNPDYLMLEEEIAKPIHEERINRDTMEQWEVHSLIVPSGEEYGYNFSTANYFDNLSDIEFGFTNEVIKQAMGGKNANITELFDTIYSTRDQVKVELWQLVTYVD